VQPELIADYACHTGENPLWHPLEQRVYWCDIPRGRLFCYDPASGHHEMLLEGEELGGFTVQADGALLLFMARGAVRLLRDGALTDVIAELPDELDSRFNDVIADPRGRVFCGTMPSASRNGRLYRLDTDGAITGVLDDIACSNGMGFTPDLREMYYTDSGRYVIYRFDYDEATGALSNRRVFARNPEAEGLPDGMTVDAEGDVWSARWDGGQLVRLAADGSVAQRIDFPARKVSSVVFGGPSYEDMYVTTAGGGEKATEGAGAGALFRLRLPGVRGRPEFFSRIGLQ
jgi:D-xylonolactonase